MKVLVTGGNGLLGSEFQENCSDFEFFNFGQDRLNIVLYEEVIKVFEEIKPDVVIHCAALTNVEFCQTNPELASKINLEGTQNICSASKLFNSKVVYISSTGIYGSHLDTPYIESDKVEPTTVHHATKYQGELVVKELGLHLIIRTGWLFGGDLNSPKNFVVKRFLDARGKDEIFADYSQVGNPTYVKDVAKIILKLIKMGKVGVYNCVNSGRAKRGDYVFEILKEFNLQTRVREAPNGYFKRVAPVSPNESAINKRLIDENIENLRDWKIALSEYIRGIKDEAFKL